MLKAINRHFSFNFFDCFSIFTAYSQANLRFSWLFSTHCRLSLCILLTRKTYPIRYGNLWIHFGPNATSRANFRLSVARSCRWKVVGSFRYVWNWCLHSYINRLLVVMTMMDLYQISYIYSYVYCCIGENIDPLSDKAIGGTCTC